MEAWAHYLLWIAIFRGEDIHWRGLEAGVRWGLATGVLGARCWGSICVASPSTLRLVFLCIQAYRWISSPLECFWNTLRPLPSLLLPLTVIQSSLPSLPWLHFLLTFHFIYISSSIFLLYDNLPVSLPSTQFVSSLLLSEIHAILPLPSAQ